MQYHLRAMTSKVRFVSINASKRNIYFVKSTHLVMAKSVTVPLSMSEEPSITDYSAVGDKCFHPVNRWSVGSCLGKVRLRREL